MGGKRRHVEFMTITFTEECSSRVLIKLSRKLKDTGSFTLPIQIGEDGVGNAWCDLRKSINLMPLSVFQTLGLGEIYPNNITLHITNLFIIVCSISFKNSE